MKSSKLKLYLLLALSMMFFILGLSGCNCSGDEVVSHKITLYTTSYTIAEGQSITIDVNKENDDTEVIFSSYNEDVVSVTNEGVVTGIKNGVGYVNVQTEDTSIDCKITVKKMSAIFSLNSEKATMPLGSVYKFQAYFHEGTLNVDDIVWSVTNGENCKFVSEKENSTFTATTKGDFVVTAKYGEYTASCDIKVVSNDAEKLATPVLKINDCKNLQWESIEGVTGYLLSLDGEEWISIDKSVTSYDVSSITDKLLSGESNTFFLLASATGDYDHIDSDVQELKFLHAYNGVYTSGKEATCQKIGEINYECQTCKKSYTDSNYIEPHSYVDWQCEKCKEYRTPELAYEYDDNYIPMPSPEEAKDKTSWWWQKYSKYLTEEVNPENTTNYIVLWKKLNGIKDTISEEDRIKCYCVSWLKDGDLNEVYVPSTYQDTKYHPDALPVYYVKPNAFARFASLRKVVFSETTRELRGACFNECSQLETVIMPGLAVFPAIDIANVYQTNNFQECFSLKQLVVGENYTNAGRNFVYFDLEGNHKNYKGQVDIYISRPLSEAGKATVALDASNYANKGLAGLLSFNYYFMDDEACGTWKYNEDKTDVIFNEHYYQNGLCKKCRKCDPVAVGHNFVDGICIECKEEQSNGLAYEYDARLEGYVVSKGMFVGEEAYVRAKYDDGVHGERSVIALTNFASSKYLKKVVLPETVKYIGPLSFGSCVNLETVIMPGVKDFYAIINDQIDFETSGARNTFFNTPKLKEVVVNSNIKIRRKVFYTDEEKYPTTIQTTLYVVGEAEIDLTIFAGMMINTLSGEQYLYDETGTKCASWRYVNGNIEKIGNHVFVNDQCKYCSAHDANGLTYKYKTVGNLTGYVLVNDNKLKNTDTEIIVPSVYNDGENGVANVIAVEDAFRNNSFITKIVLPDTVKYIGGPAFANCAELQSVIMNGVEDFYVITDGVANFESASARNTFNKSPKMKEVVVGEQINITRRKIFFTDQPLDKPILNIYVYGDQKITMPTTNANSLTGVQYLYDGTGTKCGTWRYANNGSIELLSEHEFIDGICTMCGDYQTEGLAFTYNATYGGYMVSYGSCTANEVYVPKTYDDGTNGKKDVVGLAASAFWGKTVKKIVLPKSVKYATTFSLGGLGSYVETIIMPGITEFYGTGDIKLFWNNSNLKTIVVSPDIVWGKNVFANNNKFTEINICVDSTEKWIEMPADSNGVVTGNIFLYNATSNAQCGSWTYVDGIPTPSTATHNYTDANDYVCNVCGKIKEHTHVDNLEDPTGKCTYCNEVLSKGLTYTAIYEGEEIVGYEVSKGTCTDSTIYVLSVYDNKPVTTVAQEGFKSTTATKVVLPKSVVNLKYIAFASSSVQTVIMPGVINFIDGNGNYTGARNTFLNCHALKNIVVNSEINVGRQTFHSIATNSADYNSKITIFIDGNTDSTTINATNNGMLNTTVKYLKSQWQYNSDGIPEQK